MSCIVRIGDVQFNSQMVLVKDHGILLLLQDVCWLSNAVLKKLEFIDDKQKIEAFFRSPARSQQFSEISIPNKVFRS